MTGPRSGWPRWQWRSGRSRRTSKRPTAGRPTTTARTRMLVSAAHRNAKETLAELRDLARGIHPAALDRGLAAALSALAETSSIPVELSVRTGERPSPAIEAIAYFCAAELLANVAKHSGASRATISVSDERGRMLMTVTDDGAGGARLAPGGGLAGLLRTGADGGRAPRHRQPGRRADRHHDRASGARLMAAAPAHRDRRGRRDHAGRAHPDPHPPRPRRRGRGGGRRCAAARRSTRTIPTWPSSTCACRPTHTDEGLRAAQAIRRDHPQVGVLVFSQYIETRSAAELFAGPPEASATC